jgi:hypothetical protein
VTRRLRALVVQSVVLLGQLKETEIRLSFSYAPTPPLGRRDDCKDWRLSDRPRPPRGRRARPHDRLHAFVSLLLADGSSVLDVAARQGPPSLSLNAYGHLIADLARSANRISRRALSGD